VGVVEFTEGVGGADVASVRGVMGVVDDIEGIEGVRKLLMKLPGWRYARSRATSNYWCSSASKNLVASTIFDQYFSANDNTYFSFFQKRT
jgi:hypothetical protein